MNKRWLWFLPLLACIPCCGVCGMVGERNVRARRELQARATTVLSALEAARGDAGSYPETFAVEQPLHYERCADGGFAFSYTEPSPGFLPSDFARQWNPATQTWDPRELGVDPPCR